MKVLKFGGTSVGSAARFKDVAKIVVPAGPNMVVLSAMSGTTNTLVDIAGQLYDRNQDRAHNSILQLRKKYVNVVEELYSTDEHKHKALQFIAETFDYLASFTKDFFGSVQERLILAQGELVSTFLFATLLEEQGVRVRLLPALSFMRIDRRGEPDMDNIRTSLLRILEEEKDADLYVTQGYICLNARYEVDNLRRGGSDYTACLIGAALQAEEIQIWTDIDGLHNNDPRYVENTVAVRHLHFDEAAELAYFGAKILHPSCILPAHNAGVPVRLLNTMEPEAPGTLIDNSHDTGVIKAIAAKDNIVALKVRSSRRLLAYGFLRQVFEIFESYRASIDMICTSEVGVSLTINDTRYLNEIVHDLKQYGTVSVDLDMCIVCVVGDMKWSNRGFESKVMDALKEVPVRMVSYGGSNYNISILIREEDKEMTLRSLSNKLF
ncbi:MAG: aspartate kinase [Paludibacteraceae bacterium]|nr:aspartate kinase [Paludibacteraceae bacterium]